MMLGSPGSNRILPNVQTVRAALSSAKRRSIAATSRTSATPASRRSHIMVVPAWFCWPIRRDAVIPQADEAGDDADLQLFAVSSVRPCSICASK